MVLWKSWKSLKSSLIWVFPDFRRHQKTIQRCSTPFYIPLRRLLVANIFYRSKCFIMFVSLKRLNQAFVRWNGRFFFQGPINDTELDSKHLPRVSVCLMQVFCSEDRDVVVTECLSFLLMIHSFFHQLTRVRLSTVSLFLMFFFIHLSVLK